MLIQFYFRARGEKGITEKTKSAREQLAFLATIEDETFEELFLMDAPPNHKAAGASDDVAARLLQDMSTSLTATLTAQKQSEREAVFSLTGLAGARLYLTRFTGAIPLLA